MSEKRCMLYSADCPGGRVFVGDDAIGAALADGWLDNPGLKGGAPAAKKKAAKKKAPAKKKARKKTGGK